MHRRTPRCSCPTVGSSSTSTTAPRARVTLVPSPSPALRPWNGRPSCCFDEPLVVAQVGGPFPSSSVRSVHSLGMRFVAAADGQLPGVPTIAATPTHVAPGVSADASCATSSRPRHRSPTPPAARHSSADDKWEDCSPRGPATSATATTGSCCCVSFRPRCLPPDLLHAYNPPRSTSTRRCPRPISWWRRRPRVSSTLSDPFFRTSDPIIRTVLF